MKKLVIILTSILSVSIGTANALLLSPGDFSKQSFTDVNGYTSYNKSIEWMKNNKIVSGYPDGSFGVDKCVNRGEFLKIMYKVENIDVETKIVNEPPFKDVPTSAWYAPYVQLTKEKGRVNGYPDGTFQPEKCITRAEAAKIASLEFNDGKLPQGEPSDFYSFNSASYYGDIPADSWYYQYMDYALKANTLGTDHSFENYDYEKHSNRFVPNDPMTRKEAAEMFFRFRSMKDNSKQAYDYSDEPKIATANLFYNNCTTDSSTTVTADANILTAIQKDASLVMGIDHSNETQLKNVEKILSTVTKQEFWKDITEEADKEKELDLFTNTHWSGVMGMTMTTVDDQDPKIVLVGKFDSANKFEDFLKDTVAKKMNYSTTCSKSSGITYWTSKEADFYFARYGNIFLVTNNDSLRTDAISRLENGSGFAFSNNLDKDKLAYMYINRSLFDMAKTELEKTADSSIPAELKSAIESIGNVYGYIQSDSEGFTTSVEANLKNLNSPFISKYINKSATLVNQVPGKNTFFYSEDIDLGSILDLADQSAPKEEGITKEISSKIGITNTELQSLLSSSYAISVADTSSILPAVSFYLKFETANKTSAEKTIKAIDEFINEKIQEAGDIGSDVKLKDIITKTSTDRGLTKFTIDVNKLPTTESDDLGIKMKNSLQTSGIELYYGILNNDTLVVALYPNFENEYGSSPLSADYTFAQAVNKLNGVYGAKLSFVNITNIVSYLTKIISITGESQTFMPDEAEVKQIKAVVSMFKYFISSTQVSSTSVKINAFLRVGN